jgi:hypothetical protein
MNDAKRREFAAKDSVLNDRAERLRELVIGEGPREYFVHVATGIAAGHRDILLSTDRT